MASTPYLARRAEVQTYFDRTAADAWARLTSSAPVSRIRATVRAGRDAMRETLLRWLPDDLAEARVLDAGCGTGALSVAAAARGAAVTAVDLSPTLIELARERLPSRLGLGQVNFCVGDMLDEGLGVFDHVVAMDSLIHYPLAQVIAALGKLAARTEQSILFTYAPKTPALTLMWVVGRLFPRKNRAPAIEPIAERTLHRAIAETPALAGWRIGHTQAVRSAFYKSQAVQLVKS